MISFIKLNLTKLNYFLIKCMENEDSTTFCCQAARSFSLNVESANNYNLAKFKKETISGNLYLHKVEGAQILLNINVNSSNISFYIEKQEDNLGGGRIFINEKDDRFKSKFEFLSRERRFQD